MHDITNAENQSLMPRRTKTENKKDLVEKITALLVQIDQTGDVPDELIEQPGEFLREFYEAWYANGGLVGGRPRNSIRRMRNEWLVDRKAVRSLHPKLTGQVKLSQHDGQTLIELFLSRWQYVGSRRKDALVTADGYVPFPTKNLDHLVKALTDSIFGEQAQEGGTGILLPTLSPEVTVEDSVTQEAIKSYRSLVRDADALITVSSENTVLGPSPSEGMRIWWHLMEGFSNEVATTDNVLVWIVDVGSRQVEDEGAFAHYYNTGMLALHFSSFANFSSVWDQQESNFGPIGRRLSMPDDQHRMSRWKWLNSHAVVIVRSRGSRSLESLYFDEDSSLKDIRLRYLGLDAEHLLPRTVPSRWSKKLHDFYGTEIEDLAEATLSVLYKENGWDNNDVRYCAHTKLVGDNTKTKNFDADLLSVNMIEMPSPGRLYNEAYRLAYFASLYRLFESKRRGDSAIAMAYIQRLGFQILRVDDFIKVFGIVS